MGKKQAPDPGTSSGSGMNIPDHIFGSLKTIFGVLILNFFDADADPGYGNLFDPGSGINSDPGSRINIPYPQLVFREFSTFSNTKFNI
jgi:hypothetical protein